MHRERKIKFNHRGILIIFFSTEMAVIVSGYIKSCMHECTYIVYVWNISMNDNFIIRNPIICRKIVTLLLNIIKYFLNYSFKICSVPSKYQYFIQLLKYFWKYNKSLYSSILYLSNPIFIAKNFLLNDLFFCYQDFSIKIKFFN